MNDLTATVLIQFKTCDWGKEYAKALADFNANHDTAWVSPFMARQKTYWSAQTVAWLPAYLTGAGATLSGSSVFNKVADDLLKPVTDTANSAYNTCLAGGISPAPTPSVERHFSVAIQTQLDGAVASAVSSATPGLSAQLTVNFAPQVAYQLDWQPFYRLGAWHSIARDPSEWEMAFLGDNPYTQASYTTTPMRPGVKVSPGVLTTLTGIFEQCLDYPVGYEVKTPDNLVANCQKNDTTLSFAVKRAVLMPDGALYTDVVEASTNNYSSGHYFDVTFPGLTAECSESGVVIVRHMIFGFSFHTDYTLNSDIQKLKTDDGVVRDYPMFVEGNGSLTQMVGAFPDCYLYLQEQFNYESHAFNGYREGFGAVVLHYTYQGSNPNYQGLITSVMHLLVWGGNIQGLSAYAGYSVQSNSFNSRIPCASNQIIGGVSKLVSIAGSIPVPSLTLVKSGQSNIVLTIPAVEVVTIDYGCQEGSTDVPGITSVSFSQYVKYEQGAIKVRNTLKPYDSYNVPSSYNHNYTSQVSALGIMPVFNIFTTLQNLVGVLHISASSIASGNIPNHRSPSRDYAGDYVFPYLKTTDNLATILSGLGITLINLDYHDPNNALLSYNRPGGTYVEYLPITESVTVTPYWAYAGTAELTHRQYDNTVYSPYGPYHDDFEITLHLQSGPWLSAWGYSKTYFGTIWTGTPTNGSDMPGDFYLFENQVYGANFFLQTADLWMGNYLPAQPTAHAYVSGGALILHNIVSLSGVSEGAAQMKCVNYSMNNSVANTSITDEYSDPRINTIPTNKSAIPVLGVLPDHTFASRIQNFVTL